MGSPRALRAWYQQSGESARAYEAFSVYRDLGAQRSLARVGRELGKSRALIERWSSQHEWVARVQAADDYEEMLGRQKLDQLLAEKAQDEAERITRIREMVLENREVAAKKVRQMLEWPLTEQRIVREGEDGEEITFVFHPAAWSFSTIASLHTISVGGKDGLEPVDLEDEEIEEYDYSAWSEQELEEYLRLNNKLTPKRR